MRAVGSGGGPRRSASLIAALGLLATSASVLIGMVGAPAAQAVSGGTVTTIVGGTENVDASGLDVRAFGPAAVDAAGNLFFVRLNVDTGAYALAKVSAAGLITTPATQATLTPDAFPVGTDASGDLYLSMTNSGTIDKLTPGGVLSPIAGGHAWTSSVRGVAVDAGGNAYVAEDGNVVHKVTPAGVVTVFAGQDAVYATDGTANGDGGKATAAALRDVMAVATDPSGNVYLADAYTVVRKVATSGIITRVAGAYGAPEEHTGDGGSALTAHYQHIQNLAVTAAGKVVINETYGNRIRAVSGGIVTTVAGNGDSTTGGLGDGGPATAAAVYSPSAVAVDGSGNLFIEQGDDRIRKVTAATGIITTFAGGGQGTGDGRPAAQGTLASPTAAVRDAAGNTYVADGLHGRVRKIATNGVISTIAGTGTSPQDNPLVTNVQATRVDLGSVSDVVVDHNQDIVFVEGSHVRRVNHATGVLTTLVGLDNFTPGAFVLDGDVGTTLNLIGPTDLAVDSANNVYVTTTAEYSGGSISSAAFRVERIDHSSDALTTVVGLSGGTTPATSTALAAPHGLAIDAANNVYVSDSLHHRVLKATPAGAISTIAGTGTRGTPGQANGDGGLATDAQLDEPSGLAFDAKGSLYVVDSGDNRIRQIAPGGVISSVAGTGWYGNSGDGGPALSAQFAFSGETSFTDSGLLFPGISADGLGNLLVADTNNNEIRRFALPTTTVPDAPSAVVATAGAGSASVSWTAPAATGGAAITGYVVTPHQGNTPQAEVTTGAATTSRVVTGLVSGLPYTFTVQAVNAVGRSAPSAPSTAASPTGTSAPGAPTAVHAVAGNTSAAVSWTAPAATGGAAVSAYVITPYRNGSAQPTVPFADALTAHTVTGLTNGAAYRFTVSATNAAGTGAPSAPSNLVGPTAPSGIATGNITTVAGGGTNPANGIPATQAVLSSPSGGTADAAGNRYLADTGSNQVRKVSVAGTISVLAGTGTADFTGDGGQATAASLNAPQAVAVDTAGNVYIADTGNNRVRRVATSGVISTYAGSGTQTPYSVGDGGPANAAALAQPSGLAFDASGRLVVADGTGLRRVAADGTIGSVTLLSELPDQYGIPEAKPLVPSDVALDPTTGDLLVVATIRPGFAQGSTHPAVYRVAPEGRTTVLAGGASNDCTYSPQPTGDDGPPDVACLTTSTGIAVDNIGTVYLSDANRVRRVIAGPNGPLIVPYAGSTTDGGFAGDGGPAKAALLAVPKGLWTDPSGALFIADSLNNRIRRVQPGVPAPTLASAPTAVHVTTASAQITVTWSAPANLGSLPVNTYYAELRNSAGTVAGWGYANPNQGEPLSHTWPGLVNGAPYTVVVRATTGAGDGAFSSPVAATPTGPATGPDVATHLVATAGQGSITVTWVPPTHDGGSPLTGARVMLNRADLGWADSVTVGPAVRSATFTNVDPAFAYSAAIITTNAVGDGPLSAFSNTVTPLPPPAPPSTMAAPTVVATGDRTVKLSWIAPTSNGGSPVTGYDVIAYQGSTSQGDQFFPSTALSQTIVGLTNGFPYTFTVMAVNDAGAGPPSPHSVEATPNPPPTVPSFPTGVTATAGVGQATVAWTAPTVTGGAPITGYVVTPYIGSAAQAPRPFASTATSQVIGGLSAGTGYSFTVAARNSAGTGTASVRTAVVTPTGPPGAPGVPTSVSATGGHGQATVAWSPPSSTGGSGITGYRVTPIANGVAQAPRPFTSTVTSQVIGNLANGSTYRFTVAATNGIGTGAQSAASPLVLPPFASLPGFVTRQSTDLLGRAATSAENANEVAALDGGASPAAFIGTLRRSADATTKVDPATRLYFAYFLRIPDQGGLTYWIGRVRGGTTLDAVSSGFAASAEFKNRYGPLSNRGFVNLVYTNVLSRAGEASGVDFWTGQLDTGKRTRGQVMTGFSESTEYKNKKQPGVDVAVTWIDLLGASPDQSSFDTWVTNLTTGGKSVTDLAATLLADPRYAARVS
ncbi:MAG: Sugar lactone lactonase YvrE [Acidimicrobiales bacterium]|nr:Sugar lactone lactonase YvrE [Acidimicrobiales bacterium]